MIALPRKGRRYLKDSSWIQEIVTLNQFSFPKTTGWSGRHFLFLFHDSSFECIARGLKLELKVQPYSLTIAEIAARIAAE